MVCGLFVCGKAEKDSCHSSRRIRREVTSVCVTGVSCLDRGRVVPSEKTMLVKRNAVLRPFVCRFGVTATYVSSYFFIKGGSSNDIWVGHGHMAFLNGDGRVSSMATCDT